MSIKGLLTPISNPFGSAKLEKATITAYAKEERKSSMETEKPYIYTCMFNPESFTLGSHNTLAEKEVLNKNHKPSSFINQKSETLSFKITIDGTGTNDDYDIFSAINPIKEDSRVVLDSVVAFREHIMAYNGDTHQIPFLVVSWGALNFPCRLTSTSINFTLFSKSGIPLRAEIDVSFTYDEKKKEAFAKAAISSPDLTHVRVVKAGDQLPRMCEKIYGSPNYYIWIAKVNQLDDFRNLVPGQEMYFPPVEK